YEGDFKANGTCSPPWYIFPHTDALSERDRETPNGRCASLTRHPNNTIFIVGGVSAAHPPFSPHFTHKKHPASRVF
ncbi:hypothetical protein, partial [Cronobacter muytjensii]|uniref:hypothetical protein n=1 Tax=Cronobacter muytjensii TaxID=413501 RepID=UPI001F473175